MPFNSPVVAPGRTDAAIASSARRTIRPMIRSRSSSSGEVTDMTLRARPVQPVDRRGGQLEPSRRDQLVELVYGRGARDRRGHARTRDQPGQRHRGGCRAVVFRDRVERREDSESAIVEEPALDALPAGAFREIRLGPILAAEESARQRGIADDADPRAAAEWLERRLIVGAVIQIVQRLQALVSRIAVTR